MGDTGLFVCVPWRDGKRRVHKRARAGVFLEQFLSMHGLTALVLLCDGAGCEVVVRGSFAVHFPGEMASAASARLLLACLCVYIYIYYFIIRHLLWVMKNVEVFARVAL